MAKQVASGASDMVGTMDTKNGMSVLLTSWIPVVWVGRDKQLMVKSARWLNRAERFELVHCVRFLFAAQSAGLSGHARGASTKEIQSDTIVLGDNPPFMFHV